MVNIRHQTKLTALIILLATQTLALSSLNITSLIPTPRNSSSLDAVIPHCFPEPVYPHTVEPNVPDCNAALRKLILEPGFNQRVPFSRNHRRGIKVPQGWRVRSCIIFISCENDYDADSFRYADVARQAKAVIDRCIDVDEGTTPWGGVEALGDLGTFYVSVNGVMIREETGPLDMQIAAADASTQ